MLYIGTSGWQYRDWRDRFYPSDLPQRRWLEYYAGAFATVEVNNAFYRLPERATFADWRARTPGDFRIAVKMSRYLTHIRRLRDPAEPVARFLDRVAGLGDRLGPVLLQLPPTLTADADLLAGTLRRFPAEVSVAVEPRHSSWWVDEIRRTLERHGAALCWADRQERPLTPTWRTTDFGYLRMHEGAGHPAPRYTAAALSFWADRIAGEFPDVPVHVYCNNDPGAAAICDAAAFAKVAAEHGLTVSRVTVAHSG